MHKLIYHSPKFRQSYDADKPIESVWSTFINMKPVWFDLEQLLYLKRKNYGEGLSQVNRDVLFRWESCESFWRF